MLEMEVTLLWTRKSFLILVNSSKFSTFLRMLKETSSNLWVDRNQKNYFSQHQVGIFRLKYTYFPLTTLTLILWGCSGSLVCGSDCHRDLVLVASSSSQGFLSFWWGSVLRIVSGQAERQRIEKNPIKSFWRKKKTPPRIWSIFIDQKSTKINSVLHTALTSLLPKSIKPKYPGCLL